MGLSTSFSCAWRLCAPLYRSPALALVSPPFPLPLCVKLTSLILAVFSLLSRLLLAFLAAVPSRVATLFEG